MHKHETRNVLDLLKKQLGKIESQFLGPHYPGGQRKRDPVIPAARTVQVLDDETLTHILKQAITDIRDAIDFESKDTTKRFEVERFNAFLRDEASYLHQFRLVEESKLSEIFHQILPSYIDLNSRLRFLTSVVFLQIVTDKKILTDEEISDFIVRMVKWQYKDGNNDHVQRFMDLIRGALNADIAASCLNHLTPRTNRNYVTREDEIFAFMDGVFNDFDLLPDYFDD